MFGGAGMFDVYVIESEALMVGRPKGILDFDTTTRIVEFIEIKELETDSGFNRFCDLNRLDGIQLSLVEVLQIVDRRSLYNPNEFHVKSVFWATNPLAFGIARMYEQLLHSPRIEVRVFSELEAAAEWLGVKSDRLTL
jgi:hypothetical protein